MLIIKQVLLFAITTPAYILMLTSRFPGGDKMDMFDIIFSRVLMALILVEVFADQQQWSMSFDLHLSTTLTDLFQITSKPRQHTSKPPKCHKAHNTPKKTSIAASS